MKKEKNTKEAKIDSEKLSKKNMHHQKLSQHVFSIPLGVPFLETLASVIKCGEITPLVNTKENPLSLACVTIYLPTRRSVRKLQKIFSETTDCQATILPRIRLLGSLDEEDLSIDLEEDVESHVSTLLPPMPSMERLFLVTRLVQKWKESLAKDLEKNFKEEVYVPTSLREAIRLARDLIRLMDEADLKGANWAALDDIENYNFGGYEKIILEFLAIITKYWPKILEEKGQLGHGEYCRSIMYLKAAEILENHSSDIFIAAGSTGSLPGTAHFLQTIASLPNGFVILPGLDKNLDEESWKTIAEQKDENYSFTHPQYTLAKLLMKFGVARKDVKNLGYLHEALECRSFLVSECFRPVCTTNQWVKTRKNFSAQKIGMALENVSLIEASNEREEASAIAIALRNAIDAPLKTAALITSNYSLARRVSAELKTFGIIANDSGGVSLSNTRQGVFLKFLVQSIFTPGDPVVLLSLLKHPFFHLGFCQKKMRKFIEKIEIIAFRGQYLRPDVFFLSSFLRQSADNFFKKNRYNFSLIDIDFMNSFCKRLDEILAPFLLIRKQENISFIDVLEKTMSCAQAICKNEKGEYLYFYEKEEGEKLKDCLDNLLNSNVDLSFIYHEWPEILDILMSMEVVRPFYSHPRVSIWGGLEARLQTVDTLILGSLNEGSWPRNPESDFLMSRMMRKKVNLDPSEWRVGLAAHDFEIAMGASNVILSRSRRAGEAPTLPSRWLRRISAFIGQEERMLLQARGDVFLQWSRLKNIGKRKTFLKRPSPCPALSLRPKNFSVSEIEVLRTDPYAIYAKRILRLIPFEPIIQDPGPAERGMLFHEILYKFVDANIDPKDSEAEKKLMFFADQCLKKENLPEEIQTIWCERFKKFIPHFLAFEHSQAQMVAKKFGEIRSNKINIGDTGITLSARVDRIDLLFSGLVNIFDYKTGGYPSKAYAHKLIAPQMALQAALVMRGAFPEIGSRKIEKISFIRFFSDGMVIEEPILEYKGIAKTPTDFGQEAWDFLERLMQYYNKPESVYLSSIFLQEEKERYRVYDHLARVQEWSSFVPID